MRFLVVDQDFESRVAIKKILRPYGEVDIAIDGEECIVAFCSALRDGEPYDLITMDIFMPSMDGEDALREIRQIEKESWEKFYSPTHVAIISKFEETKELYDAFYLDKASSYIAKPIDRSILLNEVKKLLAPLEEGIQ